MCIRTLFCIVSVLGVYTAAHASSSRESLRQETTSSQNVRLVKEPLRDIYVDQDGRIEIKCRFRGLQPNHILTWSKNNRTISRGRQVISDELTVDQHRYVVRGSYKKSFYELKIYDVSRFDAGNYSCQVYQQASPGSAKNETGPMLLQSNTTRVTVYYRPRPTYPECPDQLKFRKLKIGEKAPICRSEKGKPPITLELENMQDTSRITLDDKNALDFIFLTLNITEADNGMTYWCKASSTAFPDYQNKCRVGPLNVVFKPRAVIRPLKYAIHENEDAVFVCEVDSNPAPSRVIWTTYPPIDDTRMELFDDNQTLQIQNIKNTDDGRLLSCTATNDQGSDTAQRVLVIRQPNLNLPHQLSTPSPQPQKTNNSSTQTGNPPLPPCSDFAYRILIPALVGVIMVLIAIVAVLFARSRLWIFSKRLDEHSAQTEVMRPLTDYEIPPAVEPAESKHLMLSIT